MMKAWTLLAVLGAAQALDVELISTTCDESLPVTADIYLRCENGARCRFGNSSNVYGELHYSGVGDSGVENDIAYLTADLSLWTLDFNLVDMMQVPLCSDSMTADENNENDCPGDGSHQYSVTYKLPSAGSEYTSWLASGWEGSGLIQMFAEQDENMKIGECFLELKTYVTRKGEEKSLIGTPSAAAAVGIGAGVAVILGLCCCYCYCCRRKRKNNKKRVVEEDQSHFKRMEDEKSFWSRSSKKSSKSKASSASVVSDLP